MICIYYVVCCILCTRTEINELLITFCYVFNVRKILIIIVIYDTAARCPKFRTVKKNIYCRLNFEKKNCLFGSLIKQKTCTKKIVWYGMVWYGNILFDIVHNIIENILPKHKNI